ncbi:MFS transporter [Streptomyces sp. R08]|uniref:MFS transporter n=1 Tax=Streptomyces sp. R08 TaxID=3238624 RepID=A0AB39MN68_9ACTN
MTTPADPHATEPDGHGLLSRPHRSRTLAVAVAFALVAFAGLALGTVMPVAVQALDGLSLYAVAFGGYLTASLAGTVAAGGWADRQGPAAPLYASGMCFAAGSVLSGAAQSMPVFIAGRLLQGLGGGALTVVLYVVVGRGYPAALRPRVFSLVTACWILPSMIGPAIAGAVAEHLSWRWVFHGIAAFSLCTLALLRRPLSALAAQDAPAQESGPTRVGPAIAVAVGAGVLQYACSRPSPQTAVLSGAALLAVAAGLSQLLPTGTLRARRGIPSLVLLRGVAAAAYFALESYVPLFLVKAHHWTPTAAGSSLTCASLAWAAASWLQGRPTMSLTRVRVVWLGAVTHAAGAMLTLAGAVCALPVVAPAGFVVAAFGMGLLLPGVGILTLDQSPPDLQGAHTAALQLADSLCSVLLIGLCGALFNTPPTTGSPGTTAFTAVFTAAVAATVLACLIARRIGGPAPKEADHAPLRPHRTT